jgi:S-adenosylmethionine:tRNA ribosyltransferase-isomerase
MNLSDFNYHIPEEQIAQYPLKERDTSRLLVTHKKTGTFEHRLFKDIGEYLVPGDVLVLNDTRVIPVRLSGSKPTGGKAEITLIKEIGKNSWEALVKGVHEGTIMLQKDIIAQVSRLSGSMAKVEFDIQTNARRGEKDDIRDYLHEIGVMPLPIYIKRNSSTSDTKKYQTVYAQKEGAVAAPTAGLHFTESLLHTIRAKGVHVKTVTLHVGYGTFKPVTAEDIKDHRMDEEFYEISEDTADTVNTAASEGRRVIAVGTTVTRALETSAGSSAAHRLEPGTGKSSIFIYPGFRFNIVNALVTNFHLPRSTPMMLASAFSDLELIKKAYRTAQKEGYRFYSYGDAMLII